MAALSILFKGLFRPIRMNARLYFNRYWMEFVLIWIGVSRNKLKKQILHFMKFGRTMFLKYIIWRFTNGKLSFLVRKISPTTSTLTSQQSYRIIFRFDSQASYRKDTGNDPKGTTGGTDRVKNYKESYPFICWNWSSSKCFPAQIRKETQKLLWTISRGFLGWYRIILCSWIISLYQYPFDIRLSKKGTSQKIVFLLEM